MALDLALVRRGDEQDHLDVGQPDVFNGQAEKAGRFPVFLRGHFPVGDEIPFDLQVVRVGHPSEIVDHGLAEGVGRSFGRLVDSDLGLLPGRADDEILGNGDVDDEVGEVGEELGILMVGVGVPAPSLFIDPGLGIPLGDEKGVLVISRPGNGPGDLAPEIEAEMDAFPGLDGRREKDPRNGLVVGILRTVRRDELEAGLEIGTVRQADVCDVDPAPFAVVGRGAPAGHPFRRGLTEQGAVLVLESVPVKVEEHVGDRFPGGIRPDDLFLAEEHLSRGVELDPDLVAEAGRAAGGGRLLPGTGRRRQEEERGAQQRGRDDSVFHNGPPWFVNVSPSAIPPRRRAVENT